MTLECVCNGQSNRWGDGSECKEHSGYTGTDANWLNGVWCYANVDACFDAKVYPVPDTLYGASRAACLGIYDMRLL